MVSSLGLGQDSVPKSKNFRLFIYKFRNKVRQPTNILTSQGYHVAFSQFIQNNMFPSETEL